MPHEIVSQEEWTRRRLSLMDQEKELTRHYDAVVGARQALPWVKVEKTYWFEAPEGRRQLADLFDGHSQLYLYHFMFAPEWEAGCTGCSFFADHVDGANRHIGQRDVTFVAVSRAPLAKLLAYRKRMGWRFPWVSSEGPDFNHDFGVSFTAEDLAGDAKLYNFGTIKPEMADLPGVSIFVKGDDGVIYRTYSAYARGGEYSIGAYMLLDLTPKGRDETGPDGNLMDWVKRHDEYASGDTAACCRD